MRTLKRAILFSLGVLSGVLVAIFIVRNRASVSVDYYVGELTPVPMWGVVLTAFILGAVVPVALHFTGVFELYVDRRRLKKRIEELEHELVELRNLPLVEAQIDIDRPRPRVKPIVEEPRTVTPEVLPPADEIREADLYPAVYDKTKGAR